MDVQRVGTCFIVIGILLVTHGDVEFVSANTILNVALGKNASQTDTAVGITPALAVDGFPSTCSISATASANWTLDLGDFYIIEEVSETRSESQWVSSVLKATSENTGWLSTNIKGANDTNVWMAENLHFVEVWFPGTVSPTQFDIYFESGAGSVKTIKCSDIYTLSYDPIWRNNPDNITNGRQMVSHVVNSSCFANWYHLEFAVSNHPLQVDAISSRGERDNQSWQQWASIVDDVSSELSGYEASNIKGVNDGAVWQPQSALNLQYVEVMFDNKVHVTRVDVYETITPVSSSSVAQIFSPHLTASCFSNHIMVEFQLFQHDVKVDAIRLHADKPPISIQLGMTQELYQAQEIMNRSSIATWRPADKGPYRYIRIQGSPQQEPLKLCNLQIKGYVSPRKPLFKPVKFITMTIPRIGKVSNIQSIIACATICTSQTAPPCVTGQFDPERQSCAMFGGFEHRKDNDNKNETMVFQFAAHLFEN
ncbi:hypothetical protein DPMN_032565 [Dreissena polymorpha]|uniref:Apple domain-containing protein n=1 Tax=Dreissena polymorpha TaxID=45954 RepID=A0A9D4RI30_DREPO|nr:hypothetical protein DPMN_032565 [Dreissena polymorpha]